MVNAELLPAPDPAPGASSAAPAALRSVRADGPRADTAERRPYPTAGTTTRLSPARPGPRAARPGTRAERATSSIPASVWTFDSEVPLDVDWPGPVVDRVLAACAPPGGTVAFLAWPEAATSDQHHRLERPDGTGDPATDPHRLDAVVAAARAAGYQARAVRASEHLGPPDAGTVHESAPAGGGCADTVLADHTRPGTVDLVITAAAPGEVDEHRTDRIALFAAQALRAGGILAVLTHSDWTAGVLHDPTGSVVTAGQNADLLYLQHIVAVHRPVPNRCAETAPDELPHHRGGGAHRRVHSDVLVLVQPHDQALDLPNAAAA